ncbi:hypothetical protein [Natrinema salsiterrestre]|uniref:Uncharacterized protein n=1 Tax=Natrinema salsiterrestre TaxID=2950540 RepID=A0A9Q4Q397_9EURY|nr:hypothetical protein [Natrinema salsiterrestre]MDF9745877.1 hypothetical protein [Natrinema salsiterrestre]
MLDAALERSTVARILESLPDRVQRVEGALEESRLRDLSDGVVSAVRASYCYRWLTAEPDPDVIVIDLRETYTVGPIIPVLESVLDGLGDGYDGSRIATVASETAEVLRARPIQTVGAVGLALVPGSLLALTVTGALSTMLFVGHLVVAVLCAAGLRSTHSLADVLESRPVSVLAAAFEPPEPPDSRREPARESGNPDPAAPSTERTESAEPSETEGERTENSDKRE